MMTRYKWSFICFFVFSMFFIPAHFLNPQISSYDDTSYLAHAYTLGIDFDLDYKNEVATKFNNNGLLPSHPIGSGALAAPFVAFFSIELIIICKRNRLGFSLRLNLVTNHTNLFFG